jgi:dipeptidyl aminopeptidase/acylaminoacyl peptidase
MTTIRPYGTWPSPLTPAALTDGIARIVDVWVDGNDTWWLESRPAEGGRLQLVRLTARGERTDVLPDGVSARSAVHEYGGGAVWVGRGRAWFVDWADQRVKLVVPGAALVALTPEPEAARSVRFADLRPSPDGTWLVAVRETHDADGSVRNELVALRAEVPSTPVVLAGDSDFVMSPCFVDEAVAPNGVRLRWIAWDHPNMPWNDTRLLEAWFDPATGTLSTAPVVLTRGGSLMQPVGEHVVWDRSDWWNVWQVGSDGAMANVVALEAEVGGPAWVFGLRDHVIDGRGRTACAIGGTVHVIATDGSATVTPTSAASIGQWALHDDGVTVTALATFLDRHPEVVRFSLDAPAELTVVVSGPPVPLVPAAVSRPTPIEYPTDGGRPAYGWYWPPGSDDSAGPVGAAPPLVVMIHGGPTSASSPDFSLGTQFWTTRGFAVVHVDHRGSTGHGRAFRDLLDGAWGIVDVEDCCAAATWLAAEGLADPDRMVIRGGSAGGFTVLEALATRDVFAAGACSYGISDLAALANDTHKFESRYTDRLIGPWPEARDVYAARSPIHHLDGFDRPLIVFQGLDDRVVPPNQSEMIVAALRERGVECEYHAYEGEGHGFRRADTIRHALEHELSFHRRVLHLG